MLRERIKKEILKIAPKGAEFLVSRPERSVFGDYSSNVAMIVAKNSGKIRENLPKILKINLENQDFLK